jgi:hypothetical protein
MERGEVEAVSQPWSVIKAEHADWLRDKKVNLLLQTGEANPGLENLPRMVDLAPSEESRRVLEIFAAPTVVGRSFVTPPGVPVERVAELRTAFMATMQDRDFLAEAERLNFEIGPLSGAALQDFLAKDYPAALIERARTVAKLAGN